METWYLLEDGSVADPADVKPDEHGVLRCGEVAAVMRSPGVPMTRSVNADAERAKKKPPPPPKTPPAAPRRDVQAEPPTSRPYRTR